MFRAIREQIETVYKEDPAAKNALEILLCYPGVHAVLLHRISRRFYLNGHRIDILRAPDFEVCWAHLAARLSAFNKSALPALWPKLFTFCRSGCNS